LEAEGGAETAGGRMAVSAELASTGVAHQGQNLPVSVNSREHEGQRAIGSSILARFWARTEAGRKSDDTLELGMGG